MCSTRRRAPFWPRSSRRRKREGVALFHGSARDPVWEYVLSDEAAWWTFQATTEPLVLVGHSHVPLTISFDGDGLNGGVGRRRRRGRAGGQALAPEPGLRRASHATAIPRAAYLLLDLDAQRATFRRVEYDVERTQREMREAGLPELLAARLALGQ